MEVAKNPTDQNISLWFKYIEIKNKLASRLQQKVSDYLLKSRKMAPLTTQRGMNLQNKAKSNPSRFRVRMYFDSTCPHCEKMMDTLLSLQKEGYFVEALQIDNKPLDMFPIVAKRANPQDIRKHNIKEVPFTIVADLKNKVLSGPITGFQSVNGMRRIIQIMEGKKL